MMRIIKESSDHLEKEKNSISKEILEIKDKIYSDQKILDEIRNEKHKIDVELDEAKKKINSIKMFGYYLLIIFVFSMFMFLIGNLIPIALSFFVALIAVYRSKDYFKYKKTYDERYSIYAKNR